MANQYDLESIYQRLMDKEVAVRAFGGGLEAEKMMVEIKIDGPFLVTTNSQYEESEPRVVVVGQENDGWIGPYMTVLQTKTLQDVMSEYDKFDFEISWNTLFFRAIAEIRNGIFGDVGATRRRAVLWLNLFKFNCGPMQRSPYREQVLALQGDTFQEEIRLLSPDVAIFLTGPNYDPTVERFYPNVQKLEFDGHPTRELAQLSHEFLPELSFRTYHPGHMNRRRERTGGYIPAIIRKVRERFARL